MTGCATCGLPVDTTRYGCVRDERGRPHHDVCVRWVEAHPGDRIRLTEDEKRRVVR